LEHPAYSPPDASSDYRLSSGQNVGGRKVKDNCEVGKADNKRLELVAAGNGTARPTTS